MDPIIIPESPDRLPVGTSIFIPFEGFNARIHTFASGYKQGQADFKIAIDLPPQDTIQKARLFIANDLRCTGRIIEFREYSYADISHNKEILEYLRRHQK